MIRSFIGIAPAIPSSCYVDLRPRSSATWFSPKTPASGPCAVFAATSIRIRIGANSNIQDCSVLHGQTALYPVQLGDWVSVGHRATLHGCTVEDRCIIGIGAIVLNGARIGHDSIIAAGTLVPENAVVEPGSLWMGSPGKLRRALTDKDRERILWNARNYIALREQYLKELAG